MQASRHGDIVTKAKHHVSCLVCHYLIERVVLWLNTFMSITVTLKKTQAQTERLRIC